MNISKAGVDFVARWEGLRLEAYRDVAGVWTIGYGTTDSDKVYPGLVIDEQTAKAWLDEDLDVAERAVNRCVKVPLSQPQFDALVSFTYNCGTGALARSTLRRKLNAGDYDAVPSELAKWVHAGGRRVRGLINRRRDEADLWESGSDRPRDAEVAPGSVESVGGTAKPLTRSKTVGGAVVGGVAAASAVYDTIDEHAGSLSSLFSSVSESLPLIIGCVGLAAAVFVVIVRAVDRKKA